MGQQVGHSRGAKALEIAGLGVVVLFALALLATLYVGDGVAGYGGPRTGGPRGDHDGGHGVPIDGRGPPPSFLESFGFAGLVVMTAYVAALAVWAHRRGDSSFLLRHAASAAAMLALVILYLRVMGGLSYHGHSWNRAFANTSVILLAVTLAIGPLARLWQPAKFALAWRRETGIWATIAAAMHVGIYWQWSLGWDWRPFFYPGTSVLIGNRDIAPSVFHMANVLGLVAVAYLVVLSITSSDFFQRWLRSGWSWLQNRATTAWLLVLLHAWAFAYYIDGPGTIRSGTLWASFWLVLLLQMLAFVKHVWLRRAPNGTPVST